MPVTWLTTVDNRGTFIMSLNSSRHTTSNLLRSGSGTAFSLSPAVAGMEPQLLALGGLSGRASGGRGEVGPAKLEVAGVTLVGMGGAPALREGALPALERAPAQLACRVLYVLPGDGGTQVGAGGRPAKRQARGEDPGKGAAAVADADAGSGALHGLDLGHVLFLCVIEEGWVHPDYWREGKLFCGVDGVPPLLAFAGSKRFLHMSLAPLAEETEGTGARGGAQK